MFEPFFAWSEGLAVSQMYRESLWLFAVTQAMHLVAITVFMGAILVVDLRLLGWGVVGQSRAVLARSAQPVLLWASLAVLATGIPQFTANAMTYYRSPTFEFKMWLLVAAAVFTATLRRRVAAGGDRLPPWVPRAVGAASIALWIAVAASGRLISYY